MTAVDDERLVAALDADGIEVGEERGLPVALPASAAEVTGVLARAAAARARVVPTGLGTSLAWARPEARPGGDADLLLSTRKLASVTEYVPGDGTLTAQAGCTLGRLEARVAEGGHHLTPILADPGRRTLGGTIAAGSSGPDRARRGPVRHHVLGLRVALADGRVARSGGNLVKNVTGFDLHRLYTGSRGTLCVILEASLRLFPAPERVLALAAEDASIAALLARARRLAAGATPPLGLAVSGPEEGRWRLDVVLAGRSSQLDADLAALAGEVDATDRVEGPAAADALREVAAREGRPDAWPQARIVARPTALAAVVEALVAEVSPGGGRFAVQPAEGLASVFAPEVAAAAPDDQVARLRAWRALAARHGARLEPRAVDPAAHLALARPADADPRERWAEALRRRLDPDGRFRSPSYPTRS